MRLGRAQGSSDHGQSHFYRHVWNGFTFFYDGTATVDDTGRVWKAKLSDPKGVLIELHVILSSDGEKLTINGVKTSQTGSKSPGQFIYTHAKQ